MGPCIPGEPLSPGVPCIPGEPRTPRELEDEGTECVLWICFGFVDSGLVSFFVDGEGFAKGTSNTEFKEEKRSVTTIQTASNSKILEGKGFSGEPRVSEN
ncbi:MAG: hypothetical protein MAG458_00863 [Nitrosopumilus sp.]|nr:hypothetical protein [Nitrosopumilus sp.]